MNKIKSVFIISLIIALLIPFFSANAATKQVVVKASVVYKIQKGEKLKLYVKGHKKSKKIKWKTSNSKVATVTNKGVVKGKKGGTAVITAKLGKKKYKTEVRVISGTKTVNEKDVNVQEKTDRYSVIDISNIKDNEKSVVYEEWMTEKQLKKIGLSFVVLPSGEVHISGQSYNDSLTGICEVYSLNDMPSEPDIETVYGTDLRYKYNGTCFLYNTKDMKKLGLILN